MRTLSCLFLMLALLVAPAAAQHGSGTNGSGTNGSADAMPLYDNLGHLTRTITTTAPLAQQYFDQGLRFAYAFARPEAVRSFREAQRHDPGCAICYWGEAWTLGPDLNVPMDEARGVAAFRAIEQAQQRAAGASAVERALIAALAQRYEPAPTPQRRATLDATYADAMRDVAQRYPDDADVQSLFAEAAMLLRPWGQWAPEGTPETAEILGALESVLARDLHHAGACHLYIHAVEASSRPERAEACADVLAAGIPGVSHIQHMPSHVYLRIGRYIDAVRVNQKARQVDQMAEAGVATATYPAHNVNMLTYAAWLSGQRTLALQTAEDRAGMSAEAGFQPLLIRARFGEWEALLDAPAPSDDAFQQGLWRFTRGLARLRTGDAEGARADLAELTTLAATTPPERTYSFFKHPQVTLLGIARDILGGEMLAAAGRIDEAVERLERAVALEDGLAYSEPEPWFIPPRQVLGAILLEAGRPAEAERVYRADLADHADNGWSLFGLAQSLEAQGRPAEAAATRDAFDRAWRHADVWLRASRF